MFSRPFEFTASAEDDLIPLVDSSFTFKTYAKEKNPFDVLTGAITHGDEALSDEAISPSSMWSASSRPSSSPATAPETKLLSANVTARRPLAKAHTFLEYKEESRSKVQGQVEAKKTILDLVPIGEAQTFRLDGSFIYATKTQNIPRYQLHRDFDRDGSVSKLHIRAVHARETRSCSVPTTHTARDQSIRYSSEETLYSIDEFEMRGKKTGTLPGSIQMTSGESLWGGQWTRIWHVTKCKARHHVCDYRGVCEPEKHLLYCVKKGVWEDAEGVVVAREETGREGLGAANASRSLMQVGMGLEKGRKELVLEMTDGIEKDAKRRDLVMACWVMKLSTAEELRWEGN
ncbi:uncharacterized protein J4E84_010023 [Alternaria hordeiaustralica]|uniref:uncharacterized protein n=1 Tax=Alternaria hordeiaustralica TaxID=1187925 RepID=UPI0020C3007D|nr:uncharacterized protein J4E84_010023 [Alternaria hordeiaustralica]KAI4675429.1 hypothetical protein J4E84_010023 [Alternaria hordeiaustralica]